MFNWNIIIILIFLKILSIIFAHDYTNKKENNKIKIDNSEEQSQNDICMSIKARNFMICWIKYTIDTMDLSKAIINNLQNLNSYHNRLENSKEELFKLFYDLYQNINQVDKFKNIINKQIFLKISLCYAIKNEQKENIALYSNLLMANTSDLTTLFNQIKKNKKNKKNKQEQELKKSLTTNTNLYIKSLSIIKKTTNSELTREFVLGSIDTMKLLL